MNSITSLHRKAMELADQAFVARLNGDLDKAKEFSRSAFEFERVAAEQLYNNIDAEPSRSVLFRSAATLALDCGDYQEAKRLARIALSGNPPTEIANELQSLNFVE